MAKTNQSIRVFPVLLFIIVFSSASSCKKEPSRTSGPEVPILPGVDIDVEKIQNQTGIPFRILKTETVGYMPLHKFYWVSLKEKVSEEKVEILAQALIKETIAMKPETFHSFSIHFFWEDELEETVEKSTCFARATFLPGGSWLKVGREPIEDYKNYQLTCTFLREN